MCWETWEQEGGDEEFEGEWEEEEGEELVEDSSVPVHVDEDNQTPPEENKAAIVAVPSPKPATTTLPASSSVATTRPGKAVARPLDLSSPPPTGARAGTASSAAPLSPEQQFDEDGLPIERQSKRGRDDRSVPSVYFDDDGGLPFDINVDDITLADLELEVTSGNLAPRTTSRARHPRSSHVDHVPTADLQQMAKTRKHSRKHSNRLSLAVKSVETRREGVLWREVGTSWKKRFVMIQDSILKIHKSSKASSAATEYYNITSQCKVAHGRGDRSFLISIPEKVRAHHKPTLVFVRASVFYSHR